MTTATAADTPIGANTASHPWRAVISASIGNALEWFDLVVYGFFAVTIAKLFFPTHDNTTSLLLTLGTFGVSFFMRPLGAIVIGVYADRRGRREALTLTILLMMVGTAIIAFMPTYETIGLLAPVGIVLARMIQGFSAGGEFGSATAFLAEHAPQRRGFFASFQVASQGLTTLLAAGFGAVLTSTLSPEQMQSWGWRVPFLFGLLIGPVAYYIRRHVSETPEFLEAEPTETPLRDTLGHQKMRLLLAVGAVVVATVSTYLVLYMPTYAIKQLGLPASVAFAATVATGIVQMLLSPWVGAWSDRVGRARPMMIAAGALLVLIWPMFWVLSTYPGFGVMLALQTLLGVLMTMYFAPLPALASEIFPVKTRTTGLSLSYNLSVTCFGGFAPFILTWLIDATGSKLAPSFYMMAAAAAGLIALSQVYRHTGVR